MTLNAEALDERLRDELERAGFEPDFNVCNACRHRGGDHDLSNRCLECDCDCFISMSVDQKWAHGLSLLPYVRRLQAVADAARELDDSVIVQAKSYHDQPEKAGDIPRKLYEPLIALRAALAALGEEPR